MKREPREALLRQAERAAFGHSAPLAPQGAWAERTPGLRRSRPVSPSEPVKRLRGVPMTAVLPGPASESVSGIARDPVMPPLPHFLQLEPVGRCNLACRMCAVPQRPEEQQQATISVAQFDALLDAWPQLQELHLQGLGEPMLHPQFFTLVEHAVARGIRVSANTNATLITPARARACVKSGLSALSISVDGARAATYEAIRLQASFAKVVRNIERVVRARRELGAADPSLRLVMVLMRHNLEELPALVELAASLDVREVLVQRLASELNEPGLPARYIPVKTYVEGAELHGRHLADASEVFAAARERAARLGVVLHLPKLSGIARSKVAGHASNPSRRLLAPLGGGRSAEGVDDRVATGSAAQTRCDWPFDKAYITAAGDLLPCCMVGTPDRASFGNVFRDGLKAVWHGALARDWREGLLRGAPGPLCEGCALYRGLF
jgi:MoaA/NifB/PqqE/SkfB family radical SAM enzyme